MKRKTRKLLRQAIKISGADKVLYIYILYFVFTAILLRFVEPGIRSMGDSLWYCFATATTIGFGDITAVSPAGRIITIILSIYSIAVVAVFTAVITSFFLELAKVRARDSVKEFLDDLEHLPELSKDELRELSEKIKKYHAAG